MAADCPPWLAHAVDCIGVHEAPGKADNPTILAWAQVCGGEIARSYRHDETAWCAMFVNYCLAASGLCGNDSLWALNMRTFGTRLTGPAVGAIATKRRIGGGHTFFVLGRDARGRIVGVGGNQSDAVSRASFATDGLSYNWPPGYPLPKALGLATLPLVTAAAFSRKEA